MASLRYDQIYSRFYSKAQAYDFVNLSDDQINDFLCEWLHSVVNTPYTRTIFSSVLLDDEIMVMEYELARSIDEFSDQDFVIEILAVGMVMEWLEPKINSFLNTSQMFGSKEEKFYSQSNHLAELKSLYNNLFRKQRRMISDRGYAWNSYLDGN